MCMCKPTFSLQIWLPAMAARAAGTAFYAQLQAADAMSTHALDLPVAGDASGQSLRRSISLPAGGARQLKAAPSRQISGSPLDDAGSRFTVSLNLPARQPDVTYVPISLTVALIEVNGTTPSSGVIVQAQTIGAPMTPTSVPQQYNWTSSAVPVRCIIDQ